MSEITGFCASEGKTLSIVVPCYNEEACVETFVHAVDATHLPITIEYIFVDDGSADNTLPILRRLSQSDNRIRYISFSRNFGKEAALLAGLRECKGDYVVTLDVDLQHPVELLPNMLEELQSGMWDCVAAQRTTRVGEPPIRSACAKLFYKILNSFSQIEVRSGETDYRMMTRQVVDAVLSLKEVNRFTKGIYAWVGFRTKWVTFENTARIAGKTKWSFLGLLKYSIEGLSAFSTMPLQLASWLGFIACGIAFGAFVLIIVKTLIWGDPVIGWPTLACIVVFFGGLQFLVIGILGNYLAKTYLETKQRPNYFIQERK